LSQYAAGYVVRGGGEQHTKNVAAWVFGIFCLSLPLGRDYAFSFACWIFGHGQKGIYSQSKPISSQRLA
jgi:hypothetical protein